MQVVITFDAVHHDVGVQFVCRNESWCRYEGRTQTGIRLTDLQHIPPIMLDQPEVSFPYELFIDVDGRQAVMPDTDVLQSRIHTDDRSVEGGCLYACRNG